MGKSGFSFVADDLRPRRPLPPKGNAAVFCAWIAFVSTIRHAHHLWLGQPACVGLVIPEEHNFHSFKLCWETLTRHIEHLQPDPDLRSWGHVVVYEPESSRQGKVGEVEWEGATWLLGLARAKEHFPKGFLLEADAVLEVRSPTRRDIAAAALVVAGLHLTEADLDLAMSIPVTHLGGMLRRGRQHRAVREALQRTVDALHACVLPGSSEACASLTLDRLPGLGEAAIWGRQLAADLSDWKSGSLAWSDVDRGILLSGPPGTGKTTFARALAGSCGVPLVIGSMARWQAAGHLGDMLKAMHRSFNEARRKAPCILLIDEIDAAGDRETMDSEHRHYGSQVVAGLLECLDGVESREGVVVVGATNFPQHLDAAIKRPGRLDRHVVIALPDLDARAQILRYHGADLPFSDLTRLAARLEGRTGADIEIVVRSARRRARIARRKLELADLLAELPLTVPIPEDVRYRAAVHEAGHAIAAHALGYGKIIRLSIASELDRRTGQQMGGGASVECPPVPHRTREEMMVEIAVLMAGGCAEEQILGSRSEGWGGGVSSDLAKATLIAGAMVVSSGLAGTHVFLASTEPDEIKSTIRLVPGVRDRVEAILKEGDALAVKVLRRHEETISRLSDMLLRSGAVELDAIAKVLGPLTPSLKGEPQRLELN